MGNPLINEHLAQVIQDERRQAVTRTLSAATATPRPGAVRRLTGRAIIQVGVRIVGDRSEGRITSATGSRRLTS